MHLDLGSGSLKLRASNHRLDDGTWHKVDVVRNRKRGNLQVSDGKKALDLIKCKHFYGVLSLKSTRYLKLLTQSFKSKIFWKLWHKFDVVRNRKRGNLQVSDRKKH